MRLLITGSRDWDDKPGLQKALLNWWLDNERPTNPVLVSGGCPTGADLMCEEVWATQGWPVEVHKADWDHCDPEICDPKHRRIRNGKSYCPRAGFTRNRDMVNLGADACIAFIKDDSKGASMTAQLAIQAGIPVTIHRISTEEHRLA